MIPDCSEDETEEKLRHGLDGNSLFDPKPKKKLL